MMIDRTSSQRKNRYNCQTQKKRPQLKPTNCVECFHVLISNELLFDRIPKPVWAVGFAHEQTLRDATLAVFSFLILKRLQHNTKIL
jgi:hypothetical protein